MRELSLFSGIGGGIYGSLILGWETAAYVEKDEYCQAVIRQRIADGWFHQGNIYGDIAEFNRHHAAEYAGTIDVLTGGFPCQPFSLAGKRKGTDDERYLFAEIVKTIEAVQPRICFFENVPGLLTSPAVIEIYRTLGRLGYRPKPPLVLGSADCGNIHKRERVWIYAARQDSDHRCERIQGGGTGEIQGQPGISRSESIRRFEDILLRPDIPDPVFCGVDDEFPDWQQRLKAVGNGQDPIVMATAFNLLHDYPARHGLPHPKPT